MELPRRLMMLSAVKVAAAAVTMAGGMFVVVGVANPVAFVATLNLQSAGR